MFFFIIHIPLCWKGWENWNDFIYLRLINCLLSSVVEQLTRNEQVEGSTPLGGSSDRGISSVGRARPSQGRGRGFESRFPLERKGLSAQPL
jgi:hypothetical protein